MKRLALMLTLLSALFAPPRAMGDEVRGEVIERQEISVRLAPEQHLLTGESRVTLPNGTRAFTASLNPRAVVDEVAVGGERVPHTFNNGLLAVELGNRPRTAPVTLEIRYHATFFEPVAKHPVNDEDPTFGVTATITTDGVYLGSGAGWYPMTTEPPRKRIVRVDAPDGMYAVTAGKLMEMKQEGGITRSAWEEERPLGSLSLSAGAYRVATRRDHGVEVQTYFMADDADLSGRYLDATAKYLRFYEDLLGPYPFEKFAVVENFFPTGYSFPSYTLLGGVLIRLPFIIDTSLPHEIVHSWWGNGVGVDYGGGNWSEGLATYMADYLLKEKASAEAGRNYRLQILTDYASLVQPDREFPLKEFSMRADPVSRVIGYGKSAMVFHMVRTMIGDRAFFAALRDVCRDKLFGTASWTDFFRAFSARGGRDLTPFMEQWLLRPGGPRLALADVSRRPEGKGWTVTGAVIQSPPLFRVAIPLVLEADEGRLQQTLEISGQRTPFSFTMAEPPRRLAIDPDAETFRLLSREELPPSVNRIKGSQQLLVVVTPGCRAGTETLHLLVDSLGQGRARFVAENNVTPDELRGHDLLFCGVPRETGFVSVLPKGISLSSRDFTVEGTRYTQPSDLLFVTGRHPLTAGRVAAYFVPLSDSAAGQAARKITHYGNYGYLVFRNGGNIRKQVLPLGEGKSVVEFK